MISRRVICLLFVACMTNGVYAGDMGQWQYPYFISLSVGPSWTNPGQTQLIALQPDVIKNYIQTNLSNGNVLANGEAFAGVQSEFFEHIKSQFGLAFYISSAANTNGYIQEDDNPDFKNASYQYSITLLDIALKTKWIFENTYGMNPYLSGSLGVGINHSYAYSMTPLIYQELPIPPFQPNTQASFSYTVGAGFQRNLNAHMVLALGYQFVSWGSSNLKPASGQTSSTGLKLNHLYTQGIEFNINYLF